MSTERPQGAADYEADKRNMNWGSYEDDKARGLVAGTDLPVTRCNPRTSNGEHSVAK